MTIANDQLMTIASPEETTQAPERPAISVPHTAVVHPPSGLSLAALVGLRPGRPPLTPAALLEVARAYVSVTAPNQGLFDSRSYELLELTDDFEVWAIHWPVGGQLELHDHGGSSGAFWVAHGSLHESALARHGGLRQRRVEPSNGVAFGPDYIHDVVNLGPAPVTSVHAYSPPMPGMTFYRHGPEGFVAKRTEYRDEPSWAP